MGKRIYTREQLKIKQERVERKRAEELEIAGDIPPVEDEARKKKACKSLLFFLKTYFPDIFYLKFSDIHLEVVKRIEDTIKKGTCYALALPRGSGKTSICQCAILWAMLTGKRKSVVLVAANQSRADQIKKEITSLLTFSSKLLADFPEACYPFYSCANSPRRVKRMTFNGEPIRCDNSASSLVLPAIPGALCFESVLYATGLSGSIRGLSYTNVRGEKIRPDLVLVDDPQTRESANSPTQCAERRRIIYADILGLAGAGKKTACLITCTVIKQDDLADDLLTRSKSPEFNGHRFALLEKLPDNMELWAEWVKIKTLAIENDKDDTDALNFYKEHRAEMDRGAVHNWPARKDPGDPSAIYSAMNLYARDKEAFYSEYQNSPIDTLAVDSDYSVTPNQLAAQLSPVKRGDLIEGDDFLTGFIDVHKNLLYWTLVAWNRSDQSGRLVDFGTYPPQKDQFFKLENARFTICDLFPRYDFLDALNISLKTLTDDLLNREYKTNVNETILNVEKLLIDANWGDSTDAIYNFIRSQHNNTILPAHGEYYGVKSKYKYSTTNKDRLATGAGWFIPKQASRQGVRRVIVDTNYIKTEVVRRLKSPLGTSGAIKIAGDVTQLGNLFTHLTAEYGTLIEAEGRRCVEWTTKPNVDNHWFDCLAGSFVGASILGLTAGKEEQRKKDNTKNFIRRLKRGY